VPRPADDGWQMLIARSAPDDLSRCAHLLGDVACRIDRKTGKRGQKRALKSLDTLVFAIHTQFRYTSRSSSPSQSTSSLGGQEMKLQSDQIARLFAAGAVPIPPSFPQPGLVSVEPKGIRINKKDEPSVQIAHHRTPTQVTTYITSLREVAAIFLSDGFAAGEGPTWLLGEELREGEAATIQATLSKFKDGRPGTVFVSERAGVITQQECVYTAGEIAATPMSCTDYTC
jgi:hypothetical protein